MKQTAVCSVASSSGREERGTGCTGGGLLEGFSERGRNHICMYLYLYLLYIHIYISLSLSPPVIYVCMIYIYMYIRIHRWVCGSFWESKGFVRRQELHASTSSPSRVSFPTFGDLHAEQMAGPISSRNMGGILEPGRCIRIIFLLCTWASEPGEP